MKTSKKILQIIVSILIISFFSFCISTGAAYILSWSFWPLFWLCFGSQILIPICYTNLYESKKIIKSLEEYAKKPFRKYIINLNCGHCGSKNEIEIDLTETEFKCQNCKKSNGIHVNFMAAAITEPVSDVSL